VSNVVVCGFANQKDVESKKEKLKGEEGVFNTQLPSGKMKKRESV